MTCPECEPWRTKAKNWERSCLAMADRWGAVEHRACLMSAELRDVLYRDDIVQRGEASAAIAKAEQSAHNAWHDYATSERERMAQGARITQQRKRIAELERALAEAKEARR